MHKGKLVFSIIFLIANGYGILCGGLYFFQENLLFHPTQLPQDHTFTINTPFTEVTHKTQDGAVLHGLHFTVEKPKGTLLYYHGNAGDVSRWGEIVQYFVKKNLNVIVMDYRNFGKSTGDLSEQALYEDALLWYAYAKNTAKKTNTSLYVYGRSLGTTFATYVASKKEVKQLVLETPFYSIEDEAQSRFPVLPISSLLKYKFPTYKYITKVAAPITVIHGTADKVVPYMNGKRLYDLIARDSKTFVSIPDGGHNDLINYPAYNDGIDMLFKNK